MKALISLIQPAFDWTWKNSLQVALLVGLVLLVQKVLSRWLTPRLRYALSLLILLRLLLPAALPSPLSLQNLFPPTTRPAMLQGVSFAVPKPAGPITPRVAEPAAVAPATRPTVVAPFVSTPVSSPPTLSVAEVLALAWACGLVALVSLAGWRYGQWCRLIRQGRRLSDTRLLALLDGARQAMGVRRPVTLVALAHLSSPAVFGFRRVRLLLPETALDQLTDQDLRLLLMHEIAHVRRQDMLLNVLLMAVQFVHWFNPLVWLGLHRLRADRELVCDAMVLERARPEERLDYGGLLIKLVDDFPAAQRMIPTAVPVLSSKHELRRRLVLIRHHRTASLAVCLATSLVAAGLACSTFTGSSHQQMDLGPGPSLIRYSSFNGRQLLIGDSLWDVESGKELQHFRVAHPFYITATRFNPDGRRALTATAQHFGTLDLGGPVILWDVATGREISRFAPHDGYVFDVQLSPDGRRMLAVLTGTQSNSNAIQIWDVNSAQRLLVVQGLWTPLFGPPAARYVSFSPDGGRLVVLSFRTITIWDAVTGKRICTMEPQKGTAKPDFLVATQFSPDGRFVLTEQCNGVTRIWNAATGRQVQAFAVTIHSAQYWPYALFTPDGRGVISGSDDGIAILWQIESGKEIRRFQIPGPGRAPVYQMVISRDGKRLIAICESARKNDPKQGVSLWDVESGRLIKQFYGHEEIVGFSPCDETFVTVNNRKPAALWDGATGEIIREYK